MYILKLQQTQMTILIIQQVVMKFHMLQQIHTMEIYMYNKYLLIKTLTFYQVLHIYGLPFNKQIAAQVYVKF